MTMSANISQRNRILGGLWRSLGGDALGVPVEFKERATVQADPVSDMAPMY
jgi:ADP-ribosylglycohydrolase